MGNHNSTIKVKAPYDLKEGDKFNAGAYGTKFLFLEAQKSAKHHEIVEGIINPDETKIEVYALESASAGAIYLAGEKVALKHDTYQYQLKASAAGVKKNEKVTVLYQDIIETKVTPLIVENKNQIKNLPTKDDTGVDTHITEICASLSNQIYKAMTRGHFNLKARGGQKAEVHIFDNHNISKAAIPSFAVAVEGTTMIMGWRGTNLGGTKINAVMDAITDAAIGPVVCGELGEARYGIRMHNAYSSFAVSDLLTHADAIQEIIKDENINEIVFTGHSMGGGIACTAHPIVQAQISGHNDSMSAKKWLGCNVTLKSVVFSAPMSLFGIGKVVDYKGVTIKDKKSDELLEKVSENTVNLMFGCDVVPRIFSHYTYLAEVLDASGEAAQNLINKNTPPLVGSIANAFADIRGHIDLVKELGAMDLVPAIRQFRHIGKLLYYKNKEDDPLTLIDTGPIENENDDNGKWKYEGSKLNDFSFTSYKIPKGKTLKDEIDEAHSYPRNLLASYICNESE